MLLQIQLCDVFHLWNVLFDDVDNGRHEVTFPECDMDAVTMEIGVVEQVLEIQRLRRGIVALAHAHLKQVRDKNAFSPSVTFHDQKVKLHELSGDSWKRTHPKQKWKFQRTTVVNLKL